jgi:hypothetical protein
VGSHLTGNIPETLRDGTYLGPTASGFATSAKVRYLSEYGVASVQGDLLSPQFTVNDLGFMQRANLARAMAFAGVRDPHPGPRWQSAQLIAGTRELHDYRLGNLLGRDVFIEGTVTTNSFWWVDTGFDGFFPYVDDRELEDGTPLERQGTIQWFGLLNTDPRKPLQLQLNITEGRAYPRFERLNQITASFVFRPLPRLDGSLDLSYNESAGVIRQIRTAGPLPGSGNPAATFDPGQATRLDRLYLLAPQHARSISATLRATYSFTPYLTLQAYGQLFTAGLSYGGPLRAVREPGRRTIALDELRPALPEDQAPNADDRQVGLNINLILRWEWRTGSTFYLVYAHQTSNDVTPGRPGLDYGAELGLLSGAGASHGDSLLLKVDLLTAL